MTVAATSRPMLTIPQVMERLQVCYSTVYTLIREGKLPAAKVGTWRVDPDDLDAFLAKRKAVAHQETPAAAVSAAVDADREFACEGNRFL